MKNPHAMQGAGASNAVASRREVPSLIAPKIQPRPDPVDVFTPWADDEEKALRRRLRDALNISTARATRSPSGHARQLWWQVSQIACDWVTLPADKADLRDIANSLVRMFQAANTFERLEGEQG
jgi:hypothetical protein